MSGPKRLGVASAVLAGLVLLGATVLVVNDRQTAYRAASLSAENVALSLSHDIRRTIASLDDSLRAAVSGAQLDEFESLSREVRQAVLFDGAAAAAEFGGIAVIDRDGWVVYESRNAIPRLLNLAHEAFFGDHMLHPELGVLVYGPVASPLDDQRSLILSRRISRPNGSFAGVAMGSVRLDAFHHLFAELAAGQHGSVSLFNLDGRVLVQEPPLSGVAGQVLADAVENGAGLLDAPLAGEDGVRRVFAARALGSFPLAVAFGVSESDMYAGWMQRAALAGLAVVTMAALAGGMAAGLRRELRRRGSAERAAHTSAEQVRLLTDNASDMMIQLDWDGVSRFLSPACQRLLGHRADSLVGRSWLEIVHPEDQFALVSSLLALQYDGPFVPAISRLRHQDETWRQMEAHGRALPDRSGAIVVLRDVTERLQIEAKLRQSHRMEALGQLTAGVAHDFNNMLQAQLGCLELLLDELATHPTSLQFARQALQLGERGARLTSQLLSFSRQQLLSPGPITAEDMLAEVAETLARILGPTIQVLARAEPGMPPLLADRAHLESALLNLALNARDAMPDGGTLHLEACSVRSGERQPRRQVALTVRDTGIGMADATLERACEPFFTTKGTGGTGLGLASVQGFASQSGGALELSSVLGEGTTVRLLLPVAVAAAPVVAEVPDAPVRGGRVLLVDDTPDVLVTVGAFLRSAGFDVVQVLAPEEALGMLRGGASFDCLITDYAMPVMNGGQLIAQARACCPGLPALLITGWAEAGSLETLPAGTHVLRKPFRSGAILHQVQRIVSASDRQPHQPAFEKDEAE